MTRRSIAAIFVAAAFLVGSVFGWVFQRSRSERLNAAVVVVNEVGAAGLCADALQAIEDGKTATLQKLLEQRMTSAVNYATERVGDASPVGFPVPNLVEGLNRARRYAVAKGMPDLIDKCDRLLTFLTSNVRA